MKITKRLFFNFLAVVLLTGILASFVFSYGYDKRQESILREELARKAKSIASTLAEHENFYLRLMGEEMSREGRGGGPGRSIPKILSDIAMNDVWVYKSEGNLGDFPAEMENLLQESLSGKELVERRENDLYFAEPIMKEGRVLGAILLKADMTPFLEELKDTQKRFLLVLGISILISLFLAAFLSKSFLHPIEQMAGYSRKLAQGNYEESLHLSQKDELGELGKDLSFLATKLQEAKTAAQAEKAREKLFLSKIGHELRTPITRLRSSLEAYQGGRMERLTEPEILEKLYKEVRSLERLVEDLYLLAKLDTPGFTMEKEELVLQDVVEDVLHSLRKEEIAAEITEEPILLQGDYGRLRQLILNLLNNALEHGEGHVTLTLQAPLSLQITNTSSLSQEELVHLFTPFHQGEGSKGTGLGLTIAREIALAHGLQLTLKQQDGVFRAELKS